MTSREDGLVERSGRRTCATIYAPWEKGIRANERRQNLNPVKGETLPSSSLPIGCGQTANLAAVLISNPSLVSGSTIVSSWANSIFHAVPDCGSSPSPSSETSSSKSPD